MSAALLAHDAFAPVEPPGRRAGLGFALAAHALLLAALAWSVNWKTSDPEGVTAELWAALPQMAAPRTAPLPPPPTPVPTPRAEPAQPPPRPDTSAQERADAQIAIQRATRERDRLAASAAERDRERLAAAERQRTLDDQAKKQALTKERQADARAVAEHDANVRRMMAKAGTSDSAVPGAATRTAGPSANYGGRIKAYMRPFIKTPGSLGGDFTTEVELRMAPDGTIVNAHITRPSKSAVWDETVLRALDNARSLPRDLDGTVPSPMLLTFKSNE